jgi:hypothetical protein
MRKFGYSWVWGLGLVLGLSVSAGRLDADVVVSANFGDGSYVDGDLNGQNGWLQYGSVSSEPIQVSGGSVGWTGGRTVSNQDVMLPFASQIVAPNAGSLILHYDLLMSVQSAGSNPSYFAGLTTRTDNDTASNFVNSRLVARAEGSGFVFGSRVNGQGGYPFGYGTQELNFGEIYALRASINMVAGNANDFIDLYVGPDFDNLTYYASAQYGSGNVSDPSFGGMLLSQFGSGTVNESGVTIFSMRLTAIPEPTSGSLLLGLAVGLVALRRRR